MGKSKIKNLSRRKCLPINKKESDKKFFESEILQFYWDIDCEYERIRLKMARKSYRGILIQSEERRIQRMDQIPNIPKTTIKKLTAKDFQETIFSYVMKKLNFMYSETIRLGIKFGWDLKEIEKNLEPIHIGIENSRIVWTEERKQKCLICLQEKKSFYGLACNHKFCEDCYKIYLRNFLENIENEIFKKVKCPKESCKVLKKLFYLC